MVTHLARSIDVASKVTSLAEDSLRGLDLTIASWPAEFRAIIWGAVVEIASRREAEAKNER